MKIIFDYNRTLFNPDTGSLYHGVLELLKRLSKRHELFLVSKNEVGRNEKFENMSIKKYFISYTFTDKKSRQIFLDLVGDSGEVFVVGDRVAGEIKIGNELRFRTIWVRQGIFGLDNPKSEIEKPDFIVDCISDVEKIILEHEK